MNRRGRSHACCRQLNHRRSYLPGLYATGMAHRAKHDSDAYQTGRRESGQRTNKPRPPVQRTLTQAGQSLHVAAAGCQASQNSAFESLCRCDCAQVAERRIDAPAAPGFGFGIH